MYVAGPITGDPWGCVRKALVVEAWLDEQGIDCYLPQLSILGEIVRHRAYEDYMRHGFNMLDRCDGLYRMEGASPGADREVEYAMQIGLPVAMWETNDDLLRWIRAVFAQHNYRLEAGE